jgi:hypothetical protein
MKTTNNNTAKNANLKLNKSIVSKLNACNGGCKGSNGQGQGHNNSVNTLPTGVLSSILTA